MNDPKVISSFFPELHGVNKEPFSLHGIPNPAKQPRELEQTLWLEEASTILQIQRSRSGPKPLDRRAYTDFPVTGEHDLEEGCCLQDEGAEIARCSFVVAVLP